MDQKCRVLIITMILWMRHIYRNQIVSKDSMMENILKGRNKVLFYLVDRVQ